MCLCLYLFLFIILCSFDIILCNLNGAVIQLEAVLEMKKILKIYPNGVMANNEVDFSVRSGEIHALVGENGAGKTTLMKILFGIEQPTGGTISIHGKTVKIHSVSEALQLGLGMVQQHFMLVPSMTVAENIVLGAEPVKGVFLDIADAVRVTKELCEKYSFDINVSARVEDLSVGDKQKVEILKVLFRKAKVLILDEPTAVLTPQETEELFKQLLILKEQGHTIVFISHKLREVQELCDRVTIMRRAKTVGVYNMADISIDKISEYMIGQEVTTAVNTTPPRPGEVRLNASHLTYITENNKKAINDVCFSLRSGMIVGIGWRRRKRSERACRYAHRHQKANFRDHTDLREKHCREGYSPNPRPFGSIYPPRSEWRPALHRTAPLQKISHLTYIKNETTGSGRCFGGGSWPKPLNS